ncbi:MAG: hypothetical protein HY720_11265 [Planctomycetes bacterium]|nr:hypothetical protein [Planctomycetota bacterium]
MKRLFLVVPALALALVLWTAGCGSNPPPDQPSGGGPAAGGPSGGGPGPQPGGPSAGGPAPSGGSGPGPSAGGPQPEPTTPWEVTEETEETHKKGEATEEVR